MKTEKVNGGRIELPAIQLEPSAGAEAEIGSNPADMVAALKSRLAALPLFRNIAPASFDLMWAELSWFTLRGGLTLFSEGEPGDALYFVLSGRLGVFTTTADGDERMLAQVGPDETVGEMALVSGEVRSASVIALRDTELLCMPKVAFDRLLAHGNQAHTFLIDVLVRRLRETSHRSVIEEAPKAIAVLPISPSLDAGKFAATIARALTELGSKVCVLRPQPVPHPAEWYAAIEPADGMVVYEADHDGSQWTHLCLRQADRVLMLADAGSLAEVHADRTRQLLRGRRPATVELIILHGAGVRTPNLNGIPLDTYPAASHSHMREGNLADIARVTRTILNRAPGLVLSGGGARGFAHIGVIKALSEVGVPLDYFAGASMGSIIGAAAALEWDEAECRKHLVPAFVQQNPINDYMVPIVALARGRKVSRLLREHFGDALIEECWKPFFCTASNLSSGQVRVYRTGPLWQALRASVAIPGVITPVIEQGEIVVDGGVLNNMPIDLMLAMRRGPVIAVDVMRHHRMTAGLSNLEAASWRHLIRPARHGTPNIVALLMRVGTVGSEAQIRQLKARVDLLIEPPLEHIGTLDWKAYDRAVESGYRYTMELLEKRDSVALRI